MIGIVVVSRFLTKVFSAGKAEAITIFPFIFVRSSSARNNKYLINHEQIHITQALELLIIPFYLWYMTEFLIHFAKCGQFNVAYHSISFEKEAYENQQNLTYLKNRKLYRCFRYLKKK